MHNTFPRGESTKLGSLEEDAIAAVLNKHRFSVGSTKSICCLFERIWIFCSWYLRLVIRMLFFLFLVVPAPKKWRHYDSTPFSISMVYGVGGGIGGGYISQRLEKSLTLSTGHKLVIRCNINAAAHWLSVEAQDVVCVT